MTPASPTPAAAPTSTPKRRAAKGSVPPHVRHVREHLARIEAGTLAVPNPDDIYLGPDREGYFHEAIGLRLLGNPVVVIGAFRFRHLHLPGEEHARESLTAYFSSPPAPNASGYAGAGAGEVTALLPRWHETIPTFLSRLRAGADYTPVHFSARLVQVAFDFRLKNPSVLEAEKQRAGPMVPHLFRTVEGHVLRGNSHGRARKVGDDHFVAVTECEQLTPKGAIPLPSVMLHREFVAMSMPLFDESTRLAAPHWTPFLPQTGSRRHLLLG